MFTLTDFKVFVYFRGIYVFQSLCILLNATLCRVCPLKPLFLHTLLWFTHIAALKLKPLTSCPSLPSSLAPSLAFFPPVICLFLYTSFFTLCYPLHLTNSSLSPYFLSGAFVDRVQLPDDDGTSAEGEPQCNGGRSLHASWLPAEVEGLYMCFLKWSWDGGKKKCFNHFGLRPQSYCASIENIYAKKEYKTMISSCFFYQNRSKSSHVTFLSN